MNLRDCFFETPCIYPRKASLDQRTELLSPCLPIDISYSPEEKREKLNLYITGTTVPLTLYLFIFIPFLPSYFSYFVFVIIIYNLYLNNVLVGLPPWNEVLWNYVLEMRNKDVPLTFFMF